MTCGVSAVRAIASPRLASRTSPSRDASQMPAWVAWRAGRERGITRILYALCSREPPAFPRLGLSRVQLRLNRARGCTGQPWGHMNERRLVSWLQHIRGIQLRLLSRDGARLARLLCLDRRL